MSKRIIIGTFFSVSLHVSSHASSLSVFNGKSCELLTKIRIFETLLFKVSNFDLNKRLAIYRPYTENEFRIRTLYLIRQRWNISKKMRGKSVYETWPCDQVGTMENYFFFWFWWASFVSFHIQLKIYLFMKPAL